LPFDDALGGRNPATEQPIILELFY